MPRASGAALLTFALCFAWWSVHPQVFEISGGNSSLYQAGGGSASVHAPTYNMTIGAGTIDGHFSYGANIEREVGSDLYIAGDQQIDLLLPTDIFDPSHYFYARGVALKARRMHTDLFVFGGTLSTLQQSPLFEGAGFGSGMGFFSMHRAMTPKWKMWSDTIVTNQFTQISAVQFKPASKVYLAASGGIGANQPYAAASLNLSRRWIDLLASYISAGSNFRRIVVSSPIQAEPNKGNLLVSFKPAQFLSIIGGTQSYLVPNLTTNQNEESSVRSAAVILQYAGANLGGTLYDSSALGRVNHAGAFTAARDITRKLRISGNYMVSRPKGSASTSSVFTTVSEEFNQHLTVAESVSNSNGQTSLLFGGSLLTNLLTISANYENFYIPIRPDSPFQNSLLLDVSLHLFGRASLHGATFVGPTGKLLYTTNASAIAVRGESGLPAGDQMLSVGASVLRVQVLDPENHPIEGAALLIDGKPAYTNADGVFLVRERRVHQHQLKIVPDQFLEGGRWEVVSMPHIIASSMRQDAPGIIVIVRRIPLSPEAPRSTSGHTP